MYDEHVVCLRLVADVNHGIAHSSVMNIHLSEDKRLGRWDGFQFLRKIYNEFASLGKNKLENTGQKNAQLHLAEKVQKKRS